MWQQRFRGSTCDQVLLFLGGGKERVHVHLWVGWSGWGWRGGGGGADLDDGAAGQLVLDEGLHEAGGGGVHAGGGLVQADEGGAPQQRPGQTQQLLLTWDPPHCCQASLTIPEPDDDG